MFTQDDLYKLATRKLLTTMWQVLIWLSKTCNMLPQRNVVLKANLCAMLHDIDFECDIVVLRIGWCNNTFKGENI